MTYKSLNLVNEAMVCTNQRLGHYQLFSSQNSFASYAPVLNAAIELGFKTSRDLEYYLGIWIELIRDGEAEENQLPQHLLDLCQALSGPHGHVILKTYRIKHGLETP